MKDTGITKARPSGNQPGRPAIVGPTKTDFHDSGSALPPGRTNAPVKTGPITKTTSIDPKKAK